MLLSPNSCFLSGGSLFNMNAMSSNHSYSSLNASNRGGKARPNLECSIILRGVCSQHNNFPVIEGSCASKVTTRSHEWLKLRGLLCFRNNIITMHFFNSQELGHVCYLNPRSMISFCQAQSIANIKHNRTTNRTPNRTRGLRI